MSQPSQSDSAEHVAASAERMAAVRGAVANGYALVAILGSVPGGGVTYLAREDASGELVAITVDHAADDAPGTFSFNVYRELHANLPGPISSCPSCSRLIRGWQRWCACGRDLAGAQPKSEKQRRQFAVHAQQATAGEYELLGAIPYAEGGGSAYFGTQHHDGSIVALRLHEDGRFSDGTVRYGISATNPLERLDDTEASRRSGPVLLTPAHAFKVVSEELPIAADPLASTRSDEHRRLQRSGLGSGLLAKVPTPRPEEQVAIPKVCPACGSEYETGSRFCPADGTPLRPKGNTDPLIGRVLAERYHILKLVGEGGMGRVYLGEHVKMNRQCAIKVMSAQLVNDSESAMRFSREASNAARIIHPNVAAVFDYGESDGLVYIVMEYVDGESLSTILEREPSLPPHRALDIARQVADGLAAAHELGIIHRDLKPDNIIVGTSRSGREIAKVVDFGIAKAVQEGPQEALTRTGLVIGTPEYMSPEQLLGDPVDNRSDIYSLGCILYQMLTGSHTFDASTREQMITRRLTEDPPHVRAIVPELPEPLDRTVCRMLARTPANRISSAAEVREQLAPTIALGIQWDPSFKPTPRSAPTIVMNTLGGTTEKLAITPAHARRRKARIAAAALVTVGVIGGAYALGALRQSSASATPDSAAATTPGPQAADSAQSIVQTSADSGARRPNGARVPPGGVPAGTATKSAAARTAAADSVARARRAAADSQLAAAVRKPLVDFARDYAEADSTRLSLWFPDSTIVALQKSLSQMQTVNGEISQVRLVSITRDSAAAKVRFRLTVQGEMTGGTPINTQVNYEGQLLRRRGQWLLSKVTQTP